MHTLRKPTELFRATVTTELIELVAPEADAPVGAIRCVQVLTPAGPTCCFTIDRNPKDVGPGRTYWDANFPPGQVVKFYLQAQQALYGAVKAGEGGFAEPSIIIEYFDEVYGG